MSIRRFYHLFASAFVVLALFSACGWGVDPPAIGMTGLAIEDVEASEIIMLSPAFSPGVTEYAATVPYWLDAVTVTVEVADDELVVTVNGEQILPGDGVVTVSLAPGVNEVVIVVSRAEESVTYTVVVTRLGPPLLAVFGWTSYAEYQAEQDEVQIDNEAEIDFGDEMYFQREMFFRIENTGQRALQLVGADEVYVVITNDVNGNYSVSPQEPLPTEGSVPPTASFEFVILFSTNGGAGPKTATATIESDDPVNPTFVLSLTGYASC